MYEEELRRAFPHRPPCWSAVTGRTAAALPLPAARCSSSKKGPEPRGSRLFYRKRHSGQLHDKNETPSRILRGYLQQAVAAHCPEARPVAFVRGSVPEAVAPLLHHVEAFGVPNVRLQPNVLPLPAVKLQQQIPVPAARLAALALRLLLLLLRSSLEALLPLRGEANVDADVSEVISVTTWDQNQVSGELNHSGGHVPQSAGEPLGVVAHGPSPHVLGQRFKHMAAGRRLGDGFQHGAHLRRPRLGKRHS